MENVEFKKEDNKLVIYLYGDVDNKACNEYKATIIDTINKFPFLDVTLDFSNVSFIDSSGIGMILGRYNQLHQQNKSLTLRGVNKSIDKLFTLTGIWKLVDKSKEKRISV